MDGVGLPEKGACEERLGGVRDVAMLLPREKHRGQREQPMQRPWGRSVPAYTGDSKEASMDGLSE